MEPNFIRGIVLTQAAFVFLMTIAIIIYYAMQMAITPKGDRAKPWHILLIGISYLWATILICVVIRERWGTQLSYVAQNAAGIFILGDAALLLMLSHLFVQRKMTTVIKEHALQILIDEKRELAAELKKQTDGLAQMIRNVGIKADGAYHEANTTNEKIATLSKSVAGRLDQIQVNAETARRKASDVSDKADLIGETGADTNVRVRKIQGNTKNANK